MNATDNVFKVADAITTMFDGDIGTRAAMMLLISTTSDYMEVSRRERSGEDVGGAGLAVKSMCMAYAAVVSKSLIDSGLDMQAHDVVDGVLAIAHMYVVSGEYDAHARPNVDLVGVLIEGLKG